ncbi:XRE family transcriptional regulator [Lactobacillus crispatus]|uniref:helix-turn-helix domain-containing protein n=1 Tax=Lactobacillus crispatus TaxID=47770 RepID=UPI0018E34B81|nr:helix-turn-helix transcriptional regulator [Lactobacillus crispatus]MBI1715588.1 XRE family transcriptional regulator [Lactobacillus crispatus]
MSAKDNVMRLWKERRPDIKSVAELERKMDLSNGIISKWETKKPSTASAQKVADFFKVPLSEVLDDVTDESVTLNKNDQELLAMFRKETDGMSNEEKQDFQDFLGILMNTAKQIVKRRRKSEK